MSETLDRLKDFLGTSKFTMDLIPRDQYEHALEDAIDALATAERRLEGAMPKAAMIDMLSAPGCVDAFMDATTSLREHPEGYEGPCMCQLCCSYGD